MKLRLPEAGRQRAVPAGVRARGMPDADYVDVFAARTPAALTLPAEEWARVAIEGASATGRYVCWRLLLRLRLETTPGPGCVGGWRVVDRDETWIRLEASSWCMTANIVFTTEDATVFFATFVRHDRHPARVLWGAVSALHRAVAPAFLYAAIGRVGRA